MKLTLLNEFKSGNRVFPHTIVQMVLDRKITWTEAALLSVIFYFSKRNGARSGVSFKKSLLAKLIGVRAKECSGIITLLLEKGLITNTKSVNKTFYQLTIRSK